MERHGLVEVGMPLLSVLCLMRFRQMQRRMVLGWRTWTTVAFVRRCD